MGSRGKRGALETDDRDGPGVPIYLENIYEKNTNQVEIGVTASMSGKYA